MPHSFSVNWRNVLWVSVRVGVSCSLRGADKHPNVLRPNQIEEETRTNAQPMSDQITDRQRISASHVELYKDPAPSFRIRARKLFPIVFLFID